MASIVRRGLGLPIAAATTGLKVAGWAERQAWALVRARLDAAAPQPRALAAAPSSPARDASKPRTAGPALDQKMSALLDRALEQTPVASRNELFQHIVDQLVPDEARILGALSDGSRSPLVRVRARGLAGAAGAVLLENASLIGRTANASLPALTPTYVKHLLSLGLLEVGAEDPTLKSDYEILMADTTILRTVKSATRGPIAPIIERRTLALSSLGRDLWAACYPDGAAR